MTRIELQEAVAAQGVSPRSLIYFASKAELEEWIAKPKERPALESTFRERMQAHTAKTSAAQMEQRRAAREAVSG